MWNWQHKDWPYFRYDEKALYLLEEEFLLNAGKCQGIFQHTSDYEKNTLKLEIISQEALQTSRIEGEILDRDGLQSSIGKQFGLFHDNRRIRPLEQGIATLLVDLYKTALEPLDHETLWKWHNMLMQGRYDIKNIGTYRTHDDPMQIISGPIGNPKVHFEAPPSTRVKKEMNQFIRWFSQTPPLQKAHLSALTRAGIAHLYFESIHPFEDGNGRIGRAISEKALSQALKQPTLIALSHTIEKKRKDYYKHLELNTRSLDITEWLLYFAHTVLEAQKYTQQKLEFIIAKTKFFDTFKSQINARQEKALVRMLREGLEGFKGGLSAENYMRITNAPRTTTTRDLNDLVLKKALIKKGELKHTRYYLNISIETAQNGKLEN